MIKISYTFIAVYCAFIASSVLGQVESPAVGFSILELSPGDGINAQLSFKAPQYLREISRQAVSTSLTPSSLVDSAASWADDLYNGDNGQYYVEIVKVGESSTGAAVGTRRNIVDTLEGSHSVHIGGSWPSGLVSPVTYRIIKHWTIRDLFGATKGVGIASALVENTLVDASAQWSADEFNGENGPHFVEIVSIEGSTTHSMAGTRREITGTDAVTRTLTVDQAWPSGLMGSVNYRIVKHLAVRALDSGNLRGGSTVSADSFQLWSGERYETYYYQTSGLGGIGWRKAGDQFQDASLTVIEPGQGIIFNRGETVPLSLMVRGVVKSGVTPFEVNNGYNFLANPYASPMTLASATLYTGNTSTGISPGSLITADQVLVWNGSFYDTYYYQASGLGGVGWRRAGNLMADASATIIPSGSSIIIRRLAASSFTWRIPAHPVQL